MDLSEFLKRLADCHNDFVWATQCDGRIRGTHKLTGFHYCPITAVALRLGCKKTVLDADEAGLAIGIPRLLVISIIHAADDATSADVATRHGMLRAVGLQGVPS